MDKSMINQFTSYVEQLRNTECNQKEKIACFQHIAECIMSPALAGHINYATHINMATTVLLLFCEDLDPVIRMNAEENLNRIFRSLEKTRVSRILMDLYGEIKRNGNYRSLRICLNLFAYYAPQIRERNIKWYAVRLSPCLQTIAQRKETQLCETLCEFVKSFGKCLQMGLTDSESCKLFEAFMANIGVECAVKRRCSAQNCISLIENSRNKSLMANHGLSKAFEFLLTDQQQHNVLGVLGFLRLLLPLIIHGFHADCTDDCDDDHITQKHTGVNKSKANNSNNKDTHTHSTTTFTTSTSKKSTKTTSMPINSKECRQIIEIFDYCLHLLNISNASQHSIINAALEVINAILLALDVANSNNSNKNHSNPSNGNGKNNTDLIKSLQAGLCNQQLQHAEYLRRRKSLKNQIFQLRNYEVSAAVPSGVNVSAVGIQSNIKAECKEGTTSIWQKGSRTEENIVGSSGMVVDSDGEGEVVLRRAPNIRYAGRSVSECVVDEDDDEAHRTALSTDLVAIAHTDANPIRGDIYADGVVVVVGGGLLDDVDDDDDFTTLSEINEPQQLRASTAIAMVPASYALTTTIDADNLIDAIDATATRTEAANAASNKSSRVVHTKIQGIHEQNLNLQLVEQQQMLEKQVKPQNLLTAPNKQTAGAVGGGATASGSGSGDDKSQHLSDIDNESFNSIDFEAEITIAGMSIANAEEGSPKARKVEGSSNDGGTAANVDNMNASNNKLSNANSDTIGSFFNNLISNAASESMSKLFRPSAGSRATPTKTVTPTTTSDKLFDESASNTSAATSMGLVDNISLISTASSSNKVLDLSSTVAADSAHTNTQSYASSSVGIHDDTASTALLGDASLHSVGFDEADGDYGEQSAQNPVERRVPNANPFLNEKSSLKNSAPGLSLLILKIGTLFEQPIVRYTARLIAARFLLTGQAGSLYDDTQTRISIKRLSLSVFAHCVRFDPEVLQLPIEITERELLELHKQLTVSNAAGATQSPSKSSSASGSPSMPQSDDSVSGSSSNLGKDYEHVDAVDFIKNKTTRVAAAEQLPAELQLLEIKDDHFGKSNFDYLFDVTIDQLSKSADPVLMSQQISGTPTKSSKQQQHVSTLSKSEIIESKTQQQQKQYKPTYPLASTHRVTESVEDAPPQMLPPRPPKRTKSQRKSIAAATATVAALMQIDEHISGLPVPPTSASKEQHQQQLTDVLLYYKHSDPMLRGGVQQIISGFLHSVGSKEVMRLELNVQHLLAMLVKGLEDEIHTVVIQALNAFEKIFPYVVSKYLVLSTAHHECKQQQHDQKQETSTDSSRLESLAGDFVEAADKSSRKYHANATSQMQQKQQQSTNDIPNSTYSTHVSCKTPMAMGGKSANAETCTRKLFNDNDELIAALLNDFQLQSKTKQISNNSCNNNNLNNYNNTNVSTHSQSAMTGRHAISTTSSSPHLLPFAEFRISPKLLLNKLRLCHYKKYWLVQNKYAEVISNLNYAALHAVCNDCHGYCCGTTIGCGYDINAGKEYGNAGGGSKPNTDKNTVKENPSATWKSAEMFNNDLNDNVCIYESQFLDELLHLIGDDDFRVREHAAQCLCRFIIKNAKYKQRTSQQQHIYNNNAFISFGFAPTTTTAASNKFVNQFPATVGPLVGVYSGVASDAAAASTAGDNKSLSSATYETNFNLLWDFFDYRLFSGLPLPLRNLFRPMSPTPQTATNAATARGIDTVGAFAESLPQRHRAEEEKLLSKVLYRMTNKLMELDDKNAQFGIIYALKLLLQDFNFIDYQRAWIEFNFIEICQRFSYYNYVTAVDLACQNDLIDVTGKLMAGYMLASTLTADQSERMLQLQLDQLLVHSMKILNIYYHLITQQKPLLFAKVQKSDLFPNAKELALVQSLGYFGSEYVYIKLYNILKSANDSYKITINQESGRLLISLLRTCLNTLSLCIELRTHTTPLVAGTPTGSYTPIHTSSQRVNSPNSSGGVAIGLSSSSSSGRDTSPTVGTTIGGIGSSGSGTSAGYPSNATLKLIEEILQYLSKLVNYAPGECIACLRQLLKYLFGQNYGNQQRDYYATFIRPYFVVRSKGGQQLQLHHLPQHHIMAQQVGSSSRDTKAGVSDTQPQATSMLHTINSMTTTTTKTTKSLAFSTSSGIVRSAATIGSLATALQQGSKVAVGEASLSTPTMTAPSKVKHNGPNVIGKQATYVSHSQTHINFGHASFVATNEVHLNITEYYRLMGELFASGLNLQAWKSERASECVKHIKLFEPLVIYCLMLFLKSNASIQAPILELLHQLLELNVTYSVLDSKNVIFDQILNNLDLIENGIVRNGKLIIPPMMKFLIQLTHKSDRKLITIPKIISITNSLLANNAVLDCAVIALKSLAYEIFFMPPMGGSTIALNTLADYRAPFQSPVTRSPVQQRRHAAEDAVTASAAAEALLANSRELDTQKEVVLGMLEKFIDANDLHSIVALLLLRERSAQYLDDGTFGRQTEAFAEGTEERRRGACNLESTLLQDPSAVYGLVCRAMCDGRLNVCNWREFYILESCFKNYSKYVLADSKNFLALLQLFLTEDVENFSALAHATIILANVILKTEEIYLVNHIKLYLKNHPAVVERERNRNLKQQQQRTTSPHWLLDGPSTSTAAAVAAQSSNTGTLSTSASASSGSISEINYFAKVLCEKLENCLDAITSATTPPAIATDTASSACGDVAYCQLVCRFVDALHAFCCRSRHKDALQSVFRLVLAESSLLDKYCNFVTGHFVGEEGGNTVSLEGFIFGSDGGVVVTTTLAMQLQWEVLKLLSAMKLLDPVVMLQLLEQQKQKAHTQQQPQQHELQMTTNKERVKWYANMQRTLLSEICQQKPNARDWTVQQVKQLLNAGGATVVNILITDNFEFVSDLCEVAAKDHDAPADETPVGGELGSLWLNALLQHANALHKRSIRTLPPLLLRLCRETVSSGVIPAGWNLEFTCLSLKLVRRLYSRCKYSRVMLVRLERLVRRLVFECSMATVAAPLKKQQLLRQLEELVGDQLAQEALGGSSTTQFWQQLLFDTQECKLAAQPLAEQQHQQSQAQEQQQQNMIDEKWLLSQLIKFSAQPDYGAQQLTRILLEIQSEQKLYRIFNCSEFSVARVLRHAIASSMQAMLAAFRHNCIQHNPHIHYMQPNPLVRVTCAVLMTRISAEVETTTCGAAVLPSVYAEEPAIESQKCRKSESAMVYLCDSVTTLMMHIRRVEENALLYVESKFIDKFVREQLLRPESVAILLQFLDWCCRKVQHQVMTRQQVQPLDYSRQRHVHTLLQCIAELLQQRFIWMELNQMEKPTTVASTQATAETTQISQTPSSSLLTLQQRNLLLCRVLNILVLTARWTLQHTIFYRHYKQQAFNVVVREPGCSGAEAINDNDTQNLFNAASTAAAATELEGATLIVDNESDIAVGRLLQAYAPQAVFIAKLIEMHGSKELSATYLTGEAVKGGTLSGAGSAMAVAGGASSSMGISTGGGVSAVGSGVDSDAADFKSASVAQIPMNILVAIGIAVLRTNQFYAYAVTPYEIIHQQQPEQQLKEQSSPVKTTNSVAATAATSCGKLPMIPVESLSDLDVLRKFVKRLSIFGFTTRQQFEEYFMTFLLLINKVYDENMVDEQEQFQIRSTCLEAILELLITYKTFPIVGNKLSHFHHTTRWTRINCDSISLKKLHKVQLLVSEANVFYHPNLERQLRATSETNTVTNASCLRDTVIGTSQFRVNQYDLNFMWQQMEAYADNTTSNNNGENDEEMSPSGVGGDIADRKAKNILSAVSCNNEDTATKNYRYFTTQSGVDFKSSTQLIFDVLTQIIEHNHILVLPNLVKFTEICESRDQIKWIKDKALKLQETIPMDDTISHQHLIYLLCKTQAMLIPTHGELQQLCQLIGNYLKSSHIFIRNATLAGLLCLLECCSKTNTTIGKLSEELALLRELIVGYINRHGIIDVSSMQCSDMHTKLVWTLNYCLIEWTSKFVPQCPLLSNTVIAAGNFLRKTNNEDLYLCVLHGLERMVVVSNTGNGNAASLTGASNIVATSGIGIVTPALRNKIEKLALELVKLENERFSIPALQLLLSCIYVASSKQLENTELSNGIVQDEPEIIAQQTDKVDILLHCIKSSTRDAAWIYGRVLCQIICDLVPPNEILTKVIKEFLAINQPHCDVIAMIVYQVFRCAIDSTFLQMLQDWLICSLPTFLALPERKGVWCLSVIFLSASINLHLIKLFPVLLSTGAVAAAAATAASSSTSNGVGSGGGSGVGGNGNDMLAVSVGVGDGEFHKLGQHEIALFVTAAADFHAKLSGEQRIRFRDAFEKFQRQPVYAKLLQNL